MRFLTEHDKIRAGAKNASLFEHFHANSQYKAPLWSHFYIRHSKHDRFAKTGSGQTEENADKRDAFFAGWILSREGVVMEDVNIQVTRQQVDELMEKHGIDLSVGYMNSGKKTVLFKPFLHKNDHFTKTGSGQT
eukprot:COSAG06_NODE_1763_length_8449_cov_184.922275_8_plen_134_part_00